MKLPKLAEVRKLIAYVAGVAAGAVATGLLPTREAAIADSIIAVATGLGIYRVPNATPPKPTAPKE